MTYLLFLFACSTSQPELPPPKEEIKEKILVNAEMIPFFNKMESKLKGSQAKTTEEYQKLGKDLIKLNDQFVFSCTMEGEDHEILHDWLIPHINLLEQLQSAKNPQEGAELLKKINNSLSDFHSQFQSE